MDVIINTTAIQNELLLNFNKYGLTADEVVVLCQMKVIDHIAVELQSFIEQTQVSKQVLADLVSKQAIELVELNGRVVISLKPLYKLLGGATSEVKQDTVVTSNGLSQEQISKLCHIFGKTMNPNELTQINNWLSEGHSFEKIEEAIYKGLAKEISNLNYIGAILDNDRARTIEQKQSPVVRNWTI